MNSKPMIIVEVRVRKSLAGDKKGKDKFGGQGDGKLLRSKAAAGLKLFNFEVQTKPPLEDVWTDFHSMVDMFVSSVSRVRRIDEMVIP